MPVNKNALLRYYAIDACLNNSMRPYPDLEQIRRHVMRQLEIDISVSMLNKDLAQMRDLYDAPIKYDKIRRGYCYEQQGYSIKKLPLSEEQIAALDYSTALLQQLKGSRIFEQFESAINRLIEGYRVSKLLGKSEKQLIQVEEPVKTGGNDWLEPLLRAIVNRRALEITYARYGASPKVHTLSPYLIKAYRNRWYVVGYSTTRRNVLIFSLDRITDVNKSTQSFYDAPGFQPDDYFQYSFGITHIHGAQPEKIVLAFDKAQSPYILAQPLHHSQQVVESTPNGVVIELMVYDTPELLMTLLGYGNGVEVKAPASLRDKIKEIIQKMQSVYQ
ncbi:MAG: WYL domain-containing protein [Chitinophagaceae bacterium]|nr:WYL domain-containing protein [Chitinophagaceae bacterium]